MSCGSTRDQVAYAAYCALLQSGYSKSITFSNPGDADVTIICAIEPYSRTVTLNPNSSTDMESWQVWAPRQTNFPPDAITPGATITYDGNVYDAMMFQTDNGTLAETVGVTFMLETLGDRFET